MLGSRNGAVALALSLLACTPTGTPPEAEPQSFVLRPTDAEGYVEATLPPDWRLSVARSGTTPLSEGLAVALQPEGLFLGDQRLVASEHGQLDRSAIEEHLIVPLAERLPSIVPLLDQDPEARHAILFVHPDTRVGDLVDLVYTLGRQGFTTHQLAVIPSVGERVSGWGLLFSPPVYTRLPEPGLAAKDEWMVVELRDEGVRVGHRSGNWPKSWDPVVPWDSQPMQYPEPEGVEGVVFIAAPHLRVELLIEAMSASKYADRVLEAPFGGM